VRHFRRSGRATKLQLLRDDPLRRQPEVTELPPKGSDERHAAAQHDRIVSAPDGRSNLRSSEVAEVGSHPELVLDVEAGARRAVADLLVVNSFLPVPHHVIEPDSAAVESAAFEREHAEERRDTDAGTNPYHAPIALKAVRCESAEGSIHLDVLVAQ